MPNRNHDQRLRVVITGASSGIGQATAELFASRGAQPMLAARNVEALEAVAARCRNVGGEATAVGTDVMDIDAVRALTDRTDRMNFISTLSRKALQCKSK